MKKITAKSLSGIVLILKKKIKLLSKSDWFLIAIFFILTRLILIVIGLLTLRLIGNEFDFPSKVVSYTGHQSLDLWGHWDTGWYLKIAKEWYSNARLASSGMEGQATYAFFPLYPLLIRFLGGLIKNNYIAGLLISNICLYLAATYLFKYVKLKFNNFAVAMSAVVFLLVYPFSFLYSSILTESTFLLFSLFVFYSMEKKQFAKAGLAGLLASLTRSVGIFLTIPMLVKLYREKSLNLKNLLFLLLIPLGTIIFSLYNRLISGDFFAFMHVQAAWGRVFGNPITNLISPLLAHNDLLNMFSAVSGVLIIIILLVFYKFFSLEEWLYSLVIIIFPLFSGVMSVPRYTLAVFPMYLFFAKVSENRAIKDCLIIFFALLQGALFVFWVLGTYLII